MQIKRPWANVLRQFDMLRAVHLPRRLSTRHGRPALWESSKSVRESKARLEHFDISSGASEFHLSISTRQSVWTYQTQNIGAKRIFHSVWIQWFTGSCSHSCKRRNVNHKQISNAVTRSAFNISRRNAYFAHFNISCMKGTIFSTMVPYHR